MNNKPGQHPVFSQVQSRIQQGAHDLDDAFAQKGMQYIEFVDNPGTVEDPTPADKPEPDDFDNPTNIPGRFGSSVPQQCTCASMQCSVHNAAIALADYAYHLLYVMTAEKQQPPADHELVQNAYACVYDNRLFKCAHHTPFAFSLPQCPENWEAWCRGHVACREVRRQTCDLIELMEMAQPLAHYYLFMEDDFRYNCSALLLLLLLLLDHYSAALRLRCWN